jgi:hypothetical protein
MSEEQPNERAVNIEIGLRGIRRGPPRPRKSALTGEQEIYAELEMVDEEYRAATAIMARYGGVDEYGEGRLSLPAAQIEVWGFEYDGCMMNLSGDLRAACDFVFELATAAHLVVQFESVQGDASALVTTPDLLKRVQALDDAAREELGPIVLVADAAAMCERLQSVATTVGPP